MFCFVEHKKLLFFENTMAKPDWKKMDFQDTPGFQGL